MLRRRITLLQAISLNMAMMVGVGPFITIPEFVGAMGGPHALIGWILGALIAVADGLVWCELAAAFPGSGGTYHFYDAVYGASRLGRLLKFLFVWQFLFSAPLELASGALGFAKYASYLIIPLKGEAWRRPLGAGLAWRVEWWQLGALGVMAALTALAYRRIEAAGRLMVALWLGMLVTVGWIIVAGLSRLDPALVLDIPREALTPDASFAAGLGTTLGLAMYCYLGYYQVCYLGDEVIDPARTLPRSILISVVAVAAMYLLMTLGILGVVPWREVVGSEHLASDVMARLYGGWAATAVTLLIAWTGAAGTFAALLGYSRVPYAAAQAGHFFRGLAATHPTGDFPHRSLLVIGALAALACLADLPTVIAALLTSRILIQFVGQVATVIYLRRRPEQLARMPFRMGLYPLPALGALAGWLFVFATTGQAVIAYGLGSLAVGGMAFAVWDRAAAKPAQNRA
ncbi:MAG: APC family permease [Isosphaeraceae bacterium]|nr:APC family permease [Isosphaeraceae bacterium]